MEIGRFRKNLEEAVNKVFNDWNFFVSERHLQLELAQKLRCILPKSCKVLLEFPEKVDSKNVYIDMVIAYKKSRIALEIKFVQEKKTEDLKFREEVIAKGVEIKGNNPKNVRSFSVIKDIGRLEMFLQEGKFQEAYVLFVTDENELLNCSGDRTQIAKYDFGAKKIKAGKKVLHPSSPKAREEAGISNCYTNNWSPIGCSQNGKFKMLLIEVKAASGKDNG